MRLTGTDVVVIGAGAAGLFCAAEAAKRGRRVIVLEHAQKPAEKVRISGGGRCNFTNLYAKPDQYLSQNPRFCASVLAKYTPQDFISLVQQYGIAFHEKRLGQLFCNGPSTDIVNLLLSECRRPGVAIQLGTPVRQVSKPDARFCLETDAERICCESLVVASGGLSIPRMGATGCGYELAKQFGLRVVAPWPALVPLTFQVNEQRNWEGLAGVSTEVRVQCGAQQFCESMLFTHRGLSGPAILQASTYWRPEVKVRIDLSPGRDLKEHLLAEKRKGSRREPGTELGKLLPKRLAQRFLERAGITSNRFSDLPNARLAALARTLHEWSPEFAGTEGYRIAEVTAGGVDTRDLSSTMLQARTVAGLYFIGEVVDVTGHLGGYNFQWAWSSAATAGRVC